MNARYVLIVNESPAEQAEIAAALQAGSPAACPWRAVSAHSMEEAVRHCSATPLPDCILADHRLSGTHAASLLNILPRTAEGLPVAPVVVLGTALVADESRALLRAGVQEVVLRPGLSPVALCLALENAIERHALAQETCAREQALRASEAHYRHSVEFNNTQLQWTADPQGRVVTVSGHWMKYLGVPREQLLGDGWMQACHPSDLPQVLHAWSHSRSIGEPHAIEFRFRLADGSYCWVRARAAPLRDAQGRIVRWYGVTEDINARKQVEFSLRVSEERFRELADNISQLAWAADSDGWVYWFNRRWFDFTGLTQEQSLGRGWKDALHPDHAERVIAAFQHALESGKPGEDQFPMCGKDGAYRWFLSRTTPVYDVDGSVVRWYGTLTDITDQRNAESALRVSEARFRVALAHSPVLVFEQDLALRYRWIYNPIPGMEAERIVGQRTRDILRPEDAVVMEALAWRALVTGRPVRQEVSLQHQGRLLWWDLTVEPLRDTDGRISGVICAAVDQTASKRSEHALKESEERLQLALQVAHGFAFDWDLTSDCMIRSGGFASILGLEQDPQPEHRASAQHHFRHVHPDDRSVLHARRRQLDPAHPTYIAQYRVVRPDGRLVTLEEAARGSFDESGRLVRLVGMCADVTQRVEAEMRLRRNEYQLQTLADNLPDILARFDRKLRCVFVNAAIKRVTGMPTARFLGRTLGRLGMPASLQRQWQEALRQVLASGVPQSFNFSASGLAGLRFYFCRLQAERAPDGRFESVLAVVHDVTDLRVMEQEREELLSAERSARTELERVALLKDQFLATLSHELRTPLNAIVGWSHLLRQQATESQLLQDGLDVISRNARMQTQLIDDLLDMSRILAGKFVMEARSVEADIIATSAANSLRPTAERKGVQLELHNEPGLPRLRGDASRLQQVVLNLLSNAVKFTPAGGRVRLTTRRHGDCVQFVVEDTGQGIEAHFLPQLFERFSQADASVARVHDGLGLGLSIVKHLVELHQGSVTADSAGSGRGATFTVTLPTEPGTHPVPAAPSPALPPPHAVEPQGPGAQSAELRGLSVLLVDDQPDALEPVRRLLREYGAKVLTASSGFDALECLQRERPDLLVSDIGMPGMDGYQLIRKVREQLGLGPEELPAIALTAYSRNEDRHKALGSGFQVHLVKPLEPQRVVSAISQLARHNAHL